jgi:hypothetical protein
MMVRSFLLFANSHVDLKESGQNPPANSRSLNRKKQSRDKRQAARGSGQAVFVLTVLRDD